MECIGFVFKVFFFIYLTGLLGFMLDLKLRFNHYAEMFQDEIELNEWDKKQFLEAMVITIAVWPINIKTLCGY